MIQRLHILLVEDSESDAELLLHELGQDGFEIAHERVQTAAELSAALERRSWDVVVADYLLPQFSGRQALDIVRAKGLDVPFIAVSGSFGEDLAVEMMKAGADDYIMKSKLARLVPAIERELDAAQARRARAHAEAAMRYLASIVESSEDAIFGASLDGTVLSWNRGAETIFGYSADEIVGRAVAVLIPPDLPTERAEIISRIKRGERLVAYETMRVHKNGKLIPVSLTISPVKDSDGTITGASAIARDVTERKRDERERLKLIEELTAALSQVQMLKGLLPMCASCKKIRDDRGYWQQVETYIEDHSQAQFTHGICPECMARLYPEYKDKLSKGELSK
jgi:PAS domain S-box-containing protein